MPPQPPQDSYNGYKDYNNSKDNGTYSSHPNLVGNKPNMNGHHRRLPPVPNKPSVLKMGGWRQSSLPEEHNPPGYHRKYEPLQPSERHSFINKATDQPPPAPAPTTGGSHRRMKPVTPTKPSTLSFRQSSALNGSAGYSLFGTTQFQMPKVRTSRDIIQKNHLELIK